jgi:hypothetical protein
MRAQPPGIARELEALAAQRVRQRHSRRPVASLAVVRAAGGVDIRVA